MNPHLEFTTEIRDALEHQRPVVALESTVISHGLPYPYNLETGLALESEVRASGAIPATIAVLDGKVHLGLVHDQIERLARGGVAPVGPGAQGIAPVGPGTQGLEKVSLWNLPALIAKGSSGGTTVAATAHLARLVGIEVFATGGIGGVHFDDFDESADLPALARTPITVVCAGAKSILNLPATLERLETLGVPVVGYGTDVFPAFHSAESPYSVPSRLDTPLEIAVAFRAARALQLHQALMVMNPIKDGLPFNQVQTWVEAANHEARREGIHGKSLTPFLLRRISALSDGETDRVNGVLLRANARLGGQIAVALAGIGGA
jgi:pseudouridine-5'-phosphate glycosidase